MKAIEKRNNKSGMLRSVLSYAIAPMVTGIISVLVVPLVSYSFPAGEYGKINMFYTVGTLASSVFLCGLDHAVIRYYFEPPRGLSRQQIFTLALVASVAIDVFITVLILFCFGRGVSELLFDEENYFALVLLGCYIVGSTLFRLVNLSARMQGNPLQYNLQLIIQNVISKLSFVFALLWSTNYFDAVSIMAILMLLFGIGLIIFHKSDLTFSLSGISLTSIKVLVLFGFPCMLSSIASQLDAVVGRLVLAGSGYYSEVGVLAIASTLAAAFTLIPSAFNTFWAPYMYEHYKDKKQQIRDVHDYVMIAATVLTVLIMMFQDVLYVLVGEEYKVSQIYFMLLMLSPVKSFICETTGYGVMLNNKPIYATWIIIVGIIINIGVVISLSPYLGAFAAAIGVAVSSIITGIVRSCVSCKMYRSIHSYKRSIMTSSLIIFLCFSNIVIYSSLPLRIILSVLACLIIFVVYRNELRNLAFRLRQ